MAILRKGTRRIVVEGVQFVWSVRSRPTYTQGLAQGPISFAVQLDSSGGTTLLVTLNAPRPDNWLGEKGASITPSIVEHAIKQALRQGWQPGEKGKAYELSLSTLRA